eukprot:CAMPEP_0196817094 /NCGR_PEP_ID=MMETSP1362-20130617/58728_1 /TAXON_ID=163516 /ORGANISM="Leptocylindrus danicus, Strain CCMP1856" /LENGTH=47 /DNA_ID= /DNA_START= /DNA_END= /DNA_ORIENTATION=
MVAGEEEPPSPRANKPTAVPAPATTSKVAQVFFCLYSGTTTVAFVTT